MILRTVAVACLFTASAAALHGQAQVPAVAPNISPQNPAALNIPAGGTNAINNPGGVYAPGQNVWLPPSCPDNSVSAQLDTTKQVLAMILDPQSLAAFLQDENTHNPTAQLANRMTVINSYITALKNHAPH